MPRVTPTEELELIESIVADHPKGLGISAIEANLSRVGASIKPGVFQVIGTESRCQFLTMQKKLGCWWSQNGHIKKMG